MLEDRGAQTLDAPVRARTPASPKTCRCVSLDLGPRGKDRGQHDRPIPVLPSVEPPRSWSRDHVRRAEARRPEEESMKPRVVPVLVLLALSVTARLTPYLLSRLGMPLDPAGTAYPWNFSPILPLCIFGGACYAQPRLAYSIPFATLPARRPRDLGAHRALRLGVLFVSAGGLPCVRPRGDHRLRAAGRADVARRGGRGPGGVHRLLRSHELRRVGVRRRVHLTRTR